MTEYATGSINRSVSLDTESQKVLPTKNSQKLKSIVKSIHHVTGTIESSEKSIEAVSSIFMISTPFDQFFHDLIVSITPKSESDM
jgi:hypothetical protein